jgi:hypothetical protein
MSFFDPYHIFQHKQRASKKGQIIRKKPINQSKAYNGKDLEDAKKVLKAYGIPYGNQPQPVPPDPPYPLYHSSTAIADIAIAVEDDWSDLEMYNDVALITKQIIQRFMADTEFGRTLQQMDLTKITSYQCIVSGKNITYYYDPAGPHTGQPYDYEIQVFTIDRMSNFSVTLHLLDSEGPGPDVPNRYIEKTMVNYWTNNDPRLIQQNDNYDSGDGYTTSRSVMSRNFTDAYYYDYTNDDYTISDLISGNISYDLIARTYPDGQYIDTTAVISTIATVYFYIEYTD